MIIDESNNDGKEAFLTQSGELSNADSCFQPGRHTIVKIPVRLPEDKSWSTLNGRTTSSVLCRSIGSS